MRKIFLSGLFSLILISLSAQEKLAGLTYMVREPDLKKTAPPVLVLLHGYGSNERDLMHHLRELQSGYLTLSLRAPFNKDEGFSWFDVTFGKAEVINYNYDQVKESTSRVLSFISEACRKHNGDSTQVFLLGFSQGAIMAYEIAMDAPAKIKGVIALSGRMIPETMRKTGVNMALQNLKIFIAHGKSDNVIRYVDSEKAFDYLKSKKIADLTFKNYEMPHSISGAEINDIRDWLQQRAVKSQAR